MASSCAVSMPMPLARASHSRLRADAFFKPLSRTLPKPAGRFAVRASLREKAVTGFTAAALTASVVLPDAAQAAESLSPSLKNFLLSIVSGGVVLAAIAGVVVGVSSFDPVKRT